ncbi:MAG: outer membrane lipoprotein-sorting protein [Verrucomicrobiales bacterium]
MNARLFRSIAVGLSLMASGLNLIAAERGAYKDTTGEGKQMMKVLASSAPSQNSQLFGLLKIKRDDKSFEVPVSMNVITNENGTWQNIYQTQAASGVPAQILVIRHAPEAPNAYFYAVKTNTAATEPPPPMPVKGDDLYKPFAESDFWFVDLGLEFYHWPDHQIVKKEMRKGRSCRVVESINPDPKKFGYARVLSWIDYETGGLIRAEAYNAQNEMVKEFSIQKMKKVRGVWQLKQMEILHSNNDSRTLLDFDLEISE